MAADFEAEGLLEGTEGEAREGRLKLLRELEEQGVPLEELRAAVAEGRLALLPVELALEGDGKRYSLAEIAELAAVDPEYLRRQRHALGLPVQDSDERAATEADLEDARRLRILLDTGLPEEGLLEVARVIGVSMSQLAAANRTLIAGSLLEESDTEYEIATRLSGAVKSLQPLVGELLAHALTMHVREQVRHDILDRASIGTGTEVTACFADLVGFTRLGERLPVDRLGAVTGRLNELAGDVATGAVRLVKLIGDGAMLVSPDNDALLAASIDLVETAEAETDEDFPQIRAGVARGLALARGGDWYGPPINAASRITGVAYPGSVLASADARAAAAQEAFRFSFAGERRLKGLKESQKLYRVRRASVTD
jgi:adenylate cyclase